MNTPILQANDRNLDYDKLSGDIPAWIRSQSLDKGLTIGVSGGIDSAVVSTLSAMSGKALTVLEMPIHQKEGEVDRAKEHIAWLQKHFANVSSEIIDLTEIYDAMKQLQYPGKTPESEYLADVNLRSRLRAAQLYSTANRQDAMVMGTGNKVEDYGIGFFTKFGDGSVDQSPIGGLLKSEVYKLGAQLGVADSILAAKPTDGLHPNGATDEDQIGCSYDELEWGMEQVDEYKAIAASNLISWKDIDTLSNFKNRFTGRRREVLEIYLERHLGNAHKMKMPPVFDIEV